MPSERFPMANPFATRYTRPGSLTYLFSDEETAIRLVEKLRENLWWGQIIGPHGVGKSTLLATLLPRLEQAGRCPESVTLRDGQRSILRETAANWAWTDQTILIIDGYEQLSFLSRYLLKRRCRRCGVGLLVTAHADVGLPKLVSLDTNLETVKRLIHTLAESVSWPEPTDEELAGLLTKHGSNVREILFDLYNRYERDNR